MSAMPPNTPAKAPAMTEAWIRVVLPEGCESDVWDMVMSASDVLNVAVRLLDHEALAEHLNEEEARACFS